MSTRISLLWELSMPEIRDTSFLFGTMHIRDQRAFHGMDTIRACIDSCQALALEIDLQQEGAALDPFSLQFPAHTTLLDHVSLRAYQRLRKSILKAFQLDLQYFLRFIPLALVEMISERLMKEDQQLFLDAYLWEYAAGQGKQTLGIESLESQQQLLLRIPLEAQIKMLLEIGRNPGHYRALLNHLTRLYQKGELRDLYRVSRKNAGGLRKWMLFDRNQVMADRIADLIRQQSVFCGVGAAHLWGGKGVLRLLKKHGVKVRPIPLY
ncbi:MAG: TraB/GumN family protein [Saprospirales bacterium]|nr:TraB/GumN family protein [Saprospirales bacterium]